MVRKKKDDQPYRDYSDDRWFFQLLDVARWGCWTWLATLSLLAAVVTCAAYLIWL